jgi:hypothetical protein
VQQLLLPQCGSRRCPLFVMCYAQQNQVVVLLISMIKCSCKLF